MTFCGQLLFQPECPGASDLSDSGQFEDASRPSWHSPFKKLCKFFVKEDGITKLRFEEAASSDPSMEKIRISRLRVLHRGREVPFVVHPDTATDFGPGVTLYFPAERAYQERMSRNPDPFQVEGVYWLGETDLDALPLAEVSPVVSGAADTVGTGFLRWENKTIYHSGNGSDVIRNQSAYAPGRGWYSARIRRGGSFTIPFNLSGLTEEQGRNVTLRLRLVSSTPPQEPSNTPDHLISISLNGTSVGESTLSGYEDHIVPIIIPSSLFRETGNELRLTSSSAGPALNEVLLKYLTAEYDRDLVAMGNRLTFRTSASEPTPTKFLLRGFHSQEIVVARYRASDSSWSQAAGVEVIPEGTTYALSLHDTVDGEVEYVVAGIDSAFSVTRLRLRTIRDLVDPDLNADYLVLTTSELMPAGRDLAFFREQSRNLRSIVVEVEELFDLYGFGYRSPFAIKEFLTIARDRWKGNPRYAVLLGEANWDSRGYLSSTRSNSVPSFGNPVSDSWLATDELLHPILPQLSIGRIPARTLEEADRYVRHLKEYEKYGPALSDKSVLLMTGGVTQEEHTAFAAYMESLAEQFIEPFPFGGIPRRVYKKSNAIEFKETVEIRRAIEEGASWVAFFGHAAATTWDNAINNPRQLRNRHGRKPIISDLSCSTNRFAEPDIRCFGETFLFDPDDAAIAFLGSSGLGFVSTLHEIGRSLFRSVFRDTVRILGDVVQQARLDLWKTFGPSPSAVSAIQQYTLLGDPLIRLSIPAQPDLVLKPEEIRIEPFPVTDRDTLVTVNVKVQNYGLGIDDTLRVGLSSSFNGTRTRAESAFLPRLGTIDSVSFSWSPGGRGGEHLLTVDLNPIRPYPDRDVTNNVCSISLSVLSNAMGVIRPLAFSTVHADSVTLTINLPLNLDPGSRLEIQIDTLRHSSSHMLSIPLAHGGIFNYRLNGLEEGQVYYWRARLTQSGRNTPWMEQLFTTSAHLVGSTDFSGTDFPAWSQDGRTLSPEFNDGEGIQFESGRIRLKRGIRSLLLKSAGFLDGNIAEVQIDGFDFLTGVVFRGLNTVRIDPHNGEVIEVWNFDTWGDSSAAGSLTSMIHSLSEGEYLLVAAKDEASRLVGNPLREAVRSLGAVRFDSLRNRDAYLLVGRKGAPPGSVPEMLGRVRNGIIELASQLSFKSMKGIVRSPWIGPARGWLSGGIGLSPGTDPDSVRILIESVNERGDTSVSVGNARSFSSLLRSLPPTSSFLRMTAVLTETSARPDGEPELLSWSVNYQPPPELAFSEGRIAIANDHVDEGSTILVRGNLVNAGYSAADSVIIGFRILHVSSPVDVGEVMIPSISPQEIIPFSFAIPTLHLSGRQLLQVVIDPGKEQAEFFRSNNMVLKEVTILPDTTAPSVEIFFDGQMIVEGDYVSSHPEIVIRVYDATPLSYEDGVEVTVSLNDSLLQYGRDLMRIEPGSGTLRAEIRYTPELPDGEHFLRVRTTDASGNAADSSTASFRFRVRGRAALLNVVNFPNPFSADTRFTFNLVGSVLPDRLMIRIYTVAGRLVQVIESGQESVRFGFNAIVWDGRDRDGVSLPNGTYFYKVIASVGGERIEALQRCAIVR